MSKIPRIMRSHQFTPAVGSLEGVTQVFNMIDKRNNNTG